MEIEFDPAKSKANLAKHGLALADFPGWDSEPLVIEDDRFDYGETRWIALGRVDGEPRALVYTIWGSRMRLISYRCAHEEELSRHERK